MISLVSWENTTREEQRPKIERITANKMTTKNCSRLIPKRTTIWSKDILKLKERIEISLKGSISNLAPKEYLLHTPKITLEFWTLYLGDKKMRKFKEKISDFMTKSSSKSHLFLLLKQKVITTKTDLIRKGNPIFKEAKKWFSIFDIILLEYFSNWSSFRINSETLFHTMDLKGYFITLFHLNIGTILK